MKKVSVITVSFNSSNTIRETIESVLSQNYDNVEYIIVDGQSTDGTQEIIKSYGSKISKLIFEKDEGLYDAMNKAIDMATGEIIGILNSDDLFDNADVLSTVIGEFDQTQVDCVFGDVYYFNTRNPKKIIRSFRANYFTRSRITIGILPPHPAFFVRRQVYERYGKFDLQFKYASDFDLMTRFLFVHNISYSYLPVFLVKMRLGGISTQSLKRIIEINREDLQSCKKNDVPTNFFLFHLKYFFKVMYIRSIFGLLFR